jgi:hypothetical protein
VEEYIFSMSVEKTYLFRLVFLYDKDIHSLPNAPRLIWLLLLKVKSGRRDRTVEESYWLNLDFSPPLYERGLAPDYVYHYLSYCNTCNEKIFISRINKDKEVELQSHWSYRTCSITWDQAAAGSAAADWSAR